VTPDKLDPRRDGFEFDLSEDQVIEFDQLKFTDGEPVELPGMRGRLERVDFSNGMRAHLGEFVILEDTQISFENGKPKRTICVSLNLVGKMNVEFPDGSLLINSPDWGLMMRSEQPGAQCYLKAGQIIRHVGVRCDIDVLSARFGDQLPNAVLPLMTTGDNVVETRPFVISRRLRNIASMMFSNQISGTARTFKLEALSMLYLAEAIECCETGCFETAYEESVSDLERAAFEDVRGRIQSLPGSQTTVAQYALDIGLTEHRLNKIFQIEHGRSCAEFLRDTRMALARKLVNDGELQVKQIADQVGFRHVSNFSRAYREFYGESPRRKTVRG